MARLSVGCNLLTSFAPAIQIHETGEVQELTEVLVADNLLDSFEDAGIRVQQKDYLTHLALMANVVNQPDEGAASLEVPADLTWLVGGISGPGNADVGLWTGEGDPAECGDPRIEDAPRGSLYLDRQAGALWIRHYASSVYTWIAL